MAAWETRASFTVGDRNRDQGMSASATARIGAAVVGIAPLVLLAGFVYHPYISPPTDEAAIAAAAAADPTRWALAHLAIGVGYGLTVLAFLAIRRHLREAGEDRWSARALPALALGSTLFAILTGMEITLAAAAEHGGDVQAIQASLFPWFLPVLLLGAISFALGAFGFARAMARSAVLSTGPTRMVAGALLVMAGARFLPLSPAPYVIAAAGIVGLWPLAYVMWRQRTRAAAPATSARADLSART
jgi:hypothetical protein